MFTHNESAREGGGRVPRDFHPGVMGAKGSEKGKLWQEKRRNERVMLAHTTRGETLLL